MTAARTERAGARLGAPRPEVYLQPGRVFASGEGFTVRTVLGSCVSVCLFDAARCVGGMNHYVLPHRVGDREVSARYGVVAIRQLLDALEALGSRKSELEAKLFGGAHVLRSVAGTPGDLGRQNVEIARQVLGQEGIRVVAEDVGGSRSRKLLFQTDDGSAFVRKL